MSGEGSEEVVEEVTRVSYTVVSKVHSLFGGWEGIAGLSRRGVASDGRDL